MSFSIVVVVEEVFNNSELGFVILFRSIKQLINAIKIIDIISIFLFSII
ncbi:MAG TPA: hypothetical protein P5241_02535 [Candidatus Paceibacterota bacterium]|nr:hypothetical protein [Candidatus Paceibacterota bacterium]